MSTKYSYSKINDFPNHKINISVLQGEIEVANFAQTLDHINVEGDVCDIWFIYSISSEEETELNNIVDTHTAIAPPDDPIPVSMMSSSIEQAVTLGDELRDRSGKLRVQQTSRKMGTRIMWTGIGDDPTDITKVGGGETLSFHYQIGDAEPMAKYIDFNIAENETWLHEGYLTWQDGQMDTLSLQMVPHTVTVSGVTGGDMALYGGYMVVPTPPGAGNIAVVNDLTQPYGGLVYMPNNDLDEPPTAFWDADYNTDTHLYENIRPNYTMQGRYNIFSYEIVFAEFIRQIPFLGSGFIALNSSDTDQLGQGMRLKMVADTNKSKQDHNWSVACIMCLHRDHSV